MFGKGICNLVAMGAIGIAVSHASAQTAPQDNVSKFMRAKLVHAQRVLEGLSLEDYDQISKHGQELHLLSQAASWQVLQTAEYQQYSSEFRSAAKNLTDAAKKKDLDTATLAYVTITMKCVSCHKYVRRVQLASSDRPAARLFSLRPPRAEDPR